jgi:hypothetical protein
MAAAFSGKANAITLATQPKEGDSWIIYLSWKIRGKPGQRLGKVLKMISANTCWLGWRLGVCLSRNAFFILCALIRRQDK